MILAVASIARNSREKRRVTRLEHISNRAKRRAETGVTRRKLDTGMGSYRVDSLCLDIDHRERVGPGQ